VSKIPDINILRGGKFYLGPCFQRFQSMVSWLHYFGPDTRLSILVAGVHGGRGSFSPRNSQKADREDKGQGTRYMFPGHAASDLLPELGCISYFSPPHPIMPSDHESIKGLIHWLSQSPQDPILSQKPSSWQPRPQYVEPVGDISYQNIARLIIIFGRNFCKFSLYVIPS
jgi:hypothetical protein